MSQIETARPTQFTLAIRCPWCDRMGSSLWEDTAGGRRLISMQGFYDRIAKKHPYNIETACDACDRAQPLGAARL